MKRTTFVLSAVMILCCTYACLAKDSQSPAQPGPAPVVREAPGISADALKMSMDAGAKAWPMIVQKLGLTDDQQKRLLSIFLDFGKTHATLDGQIQADMINILQIMLSDNPDRSKVEANVKEINRLQGDQMMAGVKAMFAAKDVLTPAQWKTFQSMIPSLIAGAASAHPSPDSKQPPPPSR
jgi:Spy/CpxP family protein refolding chaperone